MAARTANAKSLSVNHFAQARPVGQMAAVGIAVTVHPMPRCARTDFASNHARQTALAGNAEPMAAEGFVVSALMLPHCVKKESANRFASRTAPGRNVGRMAAEAAAAIVIPGSSARRVPASAFQTVKEKTAALTAAAGFVGSALARTNVRLGNAFVRQRATARNVEPMVAAEVAENVRRAPSV